MSGHVPQLCSGLDTWLRASTWGCCLWNLGRKMRSQLQDHSPASRNGLHKAALRLGWLSAALPSRARRQAAAASCSCTAPQQEASGVWYFLQAQPARGHLYSRDGSTSCSFMDSFQSGNHCLSSVSQPFCPQTEPACPALGACLAAAGRRRG